MTEVAGQGVGARVRRKEDARHPARPRQLRLRHDPAGAERGRLPAQPGRARPHPAHREAGGQRGRACSSARTSPRQPPSSRRPRCRATSSPSGIRWRTARCASSARRSPCASRRRAPRPRTSTEQVEVEFDELPVLVDAHAARAENDGPRARAMGRQLCSSRCNLDNGFDANAKGAPVVVKREVALSRQAMVPMEGKAIAGLLGRARRPARRLRSTQVPHLIRVGLAQFLGIDQGQVRVISPDVGGGFGYKCIVQPEELCVAWLALKYPPAVPLHRGPARAPGGRRQFAPAPLPADRLRRRNAAGCSRSTPRSRSTAAPIRTGRSPSALEPGQATGNLPGPYDFRGYRCKTYCVATNKPGFLPYRGVARTGVCFAMELMIDAIARAVGREPWEVRHENLVPASAMPYDNVARKHYDSGDYPQGAAHGAREDRPRRPGASASARASPTAA